MTRSLEVHLHSFLSGLKNKKCLLAVSGGLDSMSLLKAFQEVAPKVSVSFAVVHIHHGKTEDKKLQAYRHRAHEMVLSYCKKNRISFFSNVLKTTRQKKKEYPLDVGSSEADLRSFRQKELRKILQMEKFDFVVFAHHAEDLFETRLLRLLRGTGLQGLEAMQGRKGLVLRPFLSFSKQDLKTYLQSFSSPIPYLEDPSNSSTRYLRNWLRVSWLAQLEQRLPGASLRFHQSLETILQSLEVVPSLDFCFEEGRLLRSEYIGLAHSDQRRVLALYLKRSGLKNYGLSHVRELVKRLDVEQKDLTFSLLKKRWLANARHIWCE